MSTLTLVRHGQATPFEKITDRLSPLGVSQAEALGRFWVRHGLQFDAVFSGALERHRRSAAIAGGVVRGAGLRWPEVVVLEELNEFPAEAIVSQLAPQLAPEEAEVREMIGAVESAAPGHARERAIDRLFHHVVVRWQEGASADGLESWTSFFGRVRAALGRMTAPAMDGRRSAAFTSGGVIGVAVQSVVSAPEAASLELAWRVRNCSLTGLVHKGARISLDYFNSITHLEDAALWTYR
jgi:broad specificity phosphatase PhoE